MWPELQAWWHRVMGENRPMPSQAPMTYQDSVETITGIPKGGVHYVDPRILHILGANSAVVGRYYGGPIDTALLDKQYKGNPTDDEHKLVLAHELGHRVDFLNTDPRMMAAFDSARAVNPAPNPMDYAATSHQEHFAEAFVEGGRVRGGRPSGRRVRWHHGDGRVAAVRGAEGAAAHGAPLRGDARAP